MAQDGRRISANPQTTNGTGKKAKQNNMEGPSVSNGTASFVCFNGRCELVPIDNTPFDPERCGWKLVCMIPVGYHKDRDGRLHYSIIQQEEDGKMKIESMDGEEWVCPWPANHSDGVRLLQLLGLEIKE